MIKKLAGILTMAAFLGIIAGIACQAPTPTPGYNVVWTWTPPSPSGTFTCASPACTYVVSAETITGTTCDANTSNNYKQLNSTSPATTATYTQQNTTGETVCAIVSTLWNGGTSQPSAPSAAVTSPPVPLAPSAPSGNSTVAMLDKPALPNGAPAPTKELAMNAVPMQLVGHVVRMR
jgi:hypothetical protein